jgi:Cyclin-dependent kinase inhibitor
MNVVYLVVDVVLSEEFISKNLTKKHTRFSKKYNFDFMKLILGASVVFST